MAVRLKENGIIIKEMALEYLSHQMEILMKEIGLMIINKAEEL